MTIVISPHLDDAVLGLGEFMQTTPCKVITVFAGLPAPDVITEYDAAHGFSSSAECVAARRQEDRDALAVLGATEAHLDLLDLQYRAGEPPDLTSLYAELRRRLAANQQVFVPLGLGHPDHRIVADAVIDVCPDGRSVLFYEELPYRVLQPEQVIEAFAKLADRGWVSLSPLVAPLYPGDRDVKAKAIACYRSQFPNGADDPCLLVPERTWRYWRCD